MAILDSADLDIPLIIARVVTHLSLSDRIDDSRRVPQPGILDPSDSAGEV